MDEHITKDCTRIKSIPGLPQGWLKKKNRANRASSRSQADSLSVQTPVPDEPNSTPESVPLLMTTTRIDQDQAGQLQEACKENSAKGSYDEKAAADISYSSDARERLLAKLVQGKNLYVSSDICVITESEYLQFVEEVLTSDFLCHLNRYTGSLLGENFIHIQPSLAINGMSNLEPLKLLNITGANFCFANSALQLIMGSTLLTEMINHMVFSVEFSLQGVKNLTKRLLEAVRRHRDPAIDWQLDYQLTNAWFSRKGSKPLGNQEDVVDFLHFLMDRLAAETTFNAHVENSARDEFCPVTATGKISSRTEISVENKKSLSLSAALCEGKLQVKERLRRKEVLHIEPFTVLSIPVPSCDGTVIGALDSFFSQSTSFESLPPVLLLQIDRSMVDGVKKRVSVRCDVKLKIAHKWLSENAKFLWSENLLEQLEYTLKGVICHRGSNVSSGHYVTYTKRNKQWWLCDDVMVQKLAGLPAGDVFRDVCLLLYDMEGCIFSNPVVSLIMEKPWSRIICTK